jgi:hypothetical protein
MGGGWFMSVVLSSMPGPILMTFGVAAEQIGFEPFEGDSHQISDTAAESLLQPATPLIDLDRNAAGKDYCGSGAGCGHVVAPLVC